MHRSPLLVLLYLLADAAWLTVLVTVLGWTFAQRAPLLPFFIILLMLSAGYAMGRLAPTSKTFAPRGKLTRWTWVQTACGVVLALVAVQFGPAAASMSRVWPAALLADEVASGSVMGLMLGLVAGMLIWRRGVASAIEGPIDRFANVFFWGALVVLLCALINAVCACGMLVPGDVILFFVATLAGLSLAQLPAEDGNAGGWLRNVVLVIALVLFAGAVLGKLSNAYGDAVSLSAQVMWRELVTAFVGLVVTVLGPVLEWFVQFTEWLARVSGDSNARISMPNLDGLRNFLADEEPGTSYRVFIEWLLLGLFAYGLVRAFMWRYRARFNRDLALSFDAREQLDPRSGAGFRDLLAGLLPRWLRGKEVANHDWRYPRGVPGISEVFALYFAMLDTAMRRGFRLDRTDTPRERVDALAASLRGAPVADVTERFNEACYADKASAPEDLAKLAQALERTRD